MLSIVMKYYLAAAAMRFNFMYLVCYKESFHQHIGFPMLTYEPLL